MPPLEPVASLAHLVNESGQVSSDVFFPVLEVLSFRQGLLDIGANLPHVFPHVL